MSGTAMRYGKVLGFAATMALACSAISASGAQAAEPWGPSKVASKVASRVTSNVTPKVTPAVTSCVLNGYTPTSAVLGSAAVSKTFAVQVTGCEVSQWFVFFGPFTDYAYDADPTVSLSPKGLTNADAGLWGAFYGALGADEDPSDEDAGITKDGTFSLLRRSTWNSTFNATPEPVKKNARITVKGTLTRVSWNGKKKATYGAYASRPVDIQFQAPGTTTWTTIKSVKTGKTGKVSSTVKALTTGTWRLHFKGNSVTGAANSKTDKVVVS
jgi:hypothetical protein